MIYVILGLNWALSCDVISHNEGKDRKRGCLMRPVNAIDARSVRQADYRHYIERFARADEQLISTMRSFGVPLENSAEESSRIERTRSLLDRAQALGAVSRNDEKSIATGFLSPACERCRTGVRSVSEFISLACNRSCWFCFNPNQADWSQYRSKRKDWHSELETYKQAFGGLDFIALTGGEPLLFANETCSFFREAKRSNPNAHLRLYTSGDSATPELLYQLAQCGLDEIRFSIKLDDPDEAIEETLGTIREAVRLIPTVLVEMPIVPGTYDEMTKLIASLEQCHIDGMNLLELCFPLHNASAYRARGFKLVRHPFCIPYDYGYAGALPIAGSEELALRLLVESRERDCSIGLHYCSLENKNTAQIYEQNQGGELEIPGYRFSKRTFFYETIRAFEESAALVAEQLSTLEAPVYADESQGMVAFDPALLERLNLDDSRLRLFLASAVVEQDSDGARRFREVGLQAIESSDVPRIVEAS